MEEQTFFDYYYGGESEQFAFYRIPRQLVTGSYFKNLSTDAKLLYGLLLDRMSLSMKNGWYDEQGRVYIYYPLDEIQEALCCSHGDVKRVVFESLTLRQKAMERQQAKATPDNKKQRSKPDLAIVK